LGCGNVKKYNRNFSFPLFFASRQYFALKNIIGTFNGENGVSVGFGLNSSDYIFVPIIPVIGTFRLFGSAGACHTKLCRVFHDKRHMLNRRPLAFLQLALRGKA
jgi:hypothetical protein